ncbi:MAG TPA: di-heme oxidoredictase family protein [Myxococcota bacterium]|nr:di-heme oxidoredictase family protein [Myxococcota bacterium]
MVHRLLLLLAACTREPGDTKDTGGPGDSDDTTPGLDGPRHAPIGVGFTGPMGSPMPLATPEQLEAFHRGEELAKKRFTPEEGLGPQFNGVSCLSCHERPVLGGGGELYRNLFMAGRWQEERGFVLTPLQKESVPGSASDGVFRMYNVGPPGTPAQQPLQDDVGLFAARNPVPLFGSGVMFAIDEDAILQYEDPDDDDGDGISGRPNIDAGGVGRLGSKSMGAGHTSIMRIDFYVHSGLSVALPTPEQIATFPFPDYLTGTGSFLADADDAVPDPEVDAQTYFDIMSWVQLLAAPELDPLDEVSGRGRDLFDEIGCDACHIPRLPSPYGPVHAYTDFMLHDMGEDLWDGYVMDYSQGGEFKTAPLWGVVATGPYLHDGRARTLQEAILWHGGEAAPAHDRYLDLPQDDRDAIVAFLGTLGGRDLVSPGLLPPGSPLPAAGDWGGPMPGTTPDALAAFAEGRLLFDRSFGIAEGLGMPAFNGDACRACHFDPVIGGAGPLDVNVIRGGHVDEAGVYTPVDGYDVIHRMLLLDSRPRRVPPEGNVLEHRQTPAIFGLGLLEEVTEAAILANADPDDRRAPFGISGRAPTLPDGRLGRFGWKAQVPTLLEFAESALSDEMGLTVPAAGTTQYGRTTDADRRPDPEVDLDVISSLTVFMRGLAPPPAGAPDAGGQAVFERVGCDDCHTPSLDGPSGPVRAYTDMLLHDVLPAGVPGIRQGVATEGEFRTPPLWGVSHTPPYMHDGSATTLADAIDHHDGEAAASRRSWAALSPADRQRLLTFLGGL